MNYHMHTILPIAYPSPNCECGEARGTKDHFLLTHNEPRRILINKLDQVYHDDDVPRRILINKLDQIYHDDDVPTEDHRFDTNVLIGRNLFLTGN